MSTPAGWYDDGRGTQRWWDGTAWTEHTQPAAPATAQPAAPAEPATTAAPVAAAPVAPEAPEPVPPAAAPGSDANPVPPVPSVGTDIPPAPGYPGVPAGAYPPAADVGAYSPAAASGAYPPPTVPAVAGAYPPGGGAPAPGQKSSKAWIIPVAIIGGIVVLLIILAAILIPILVGSFGGGGSTAGQTPDEQEAVAAVEGYDDAWKNADCDLFLAVTTDAFRASQDLPDCETFVPQAETFVESNTDYEITVTSVTTGEDGITVETVETYTSLYDEEGEPAPDGIPVTENWTYSLIEDDGWRIDAVTVE